MAHLSVDGVSLLGRVCDAIAAGDVLFEILLLVITAFVFAAEFDFVVISGAFASVGGGGGGPTWPPLCSASDTTTSAVAAVAFGIGMSTKHMRDDAALSFSPFDGCVTPGLLLSAPSVKSMLLLVAVALFEFSPLDKIVVSLWFSRINCK